jgi:tRNA pseudouridine55 synthase
MDGVLILDKPHGPTSHDLVDAVRRAVGVRRVGHGGTLDPAATGVMVLLVGREATRLQPLVQRQRKTYEAEVCLGVRTDSADAAGRVVEEASVPARSMADVAEVLRALVGPLEQTPPAYSAVHIQGRRAYWWARRGVVMDATPRTIEIYDAEAFEVALPMVRVRVSCSSGTYIRTLAEQIAQRLGTVGHVNRLARTAVGPWTLEQARPMTWLRAAPVDEILASIQPAAEVAARLDRFDTSTSRPPSNDGVACSPSVSAS